MRPALHFTPRSGWINDPHGITARDDGYDVFYQYVPGETTWAPNCHWGHASGPDLLSLRELPVAIAPGDGDDGIWTGAIVRDGDAARAFYTATTVPDFGIGRIRVAYAEDDWSTWSKGDVVVEAPADLDLIAYRDPFVRRDGDLWRMFVGAAGRDGTAMALSYTSGDLDAWDYEGVALERNTAELDPVWMGALWECPQMFDLDGQSVMISSVWDADVLHYAGFALGSLDGGRFAAESWGRLTWGPSLYAPSLFTDADGRHALTFWLRGVGGADWTGAHSIPYRPTLVDGRLVVEPHPDVLDHRVPSWGDGVVDRLAADIEWSAADGVLTIVSGSAPIITFTRAGDEVVAETPTSRSVFPAIGAMRIVLDGPIIEVSSMGGAFATGVEPSGPGVRVTATAGDLSVFGLA
ncbi:MULTISPECIES: glycoside hydrolase family 32 protein [unclassified Microbacterium]|uniref:glycoside hydrolase family 32 protein n=1 Tax=unclassified Microbacterium TaxID=2609290 RepID=UPI003417ED31